MERRHENCDMPTLPNLFAVSCLDPSIDQELLDATGHRTCCKMSDSQAPELARTAVFFI